MSNHDTNPDSDWDRPRPRPRRPKPEEIAEEIGEKSNEEIDEDERPQRRRVRRRRTQGPELTSYELLTLARRQVRTPAGILLIAWLIVLIIDVNLFAHAVRHVVDPAINAKSQLWQDLGEIFLWFSLAVLPLCFWGLFCSVRLFRLKGYWSGVASSAVLLFLSFAYWIVCHPLFLAPLLALILLRQRWVLIGFALIKTNPPLPSTAARRNPFDGSGPTAEAPPPPPPENPFEGFDFTNDAPPPK